MTSLYIDSSQRLYVGLLDDNQNWMGLTELEDSKKSKILHSSLQNLFDEYNVNPKELKKVYVSLGPGSYTGIRLASGLADILEWQGVEVISFLNHHIPYYLQVGEGDQWIAKAFKGEYFIYTISTDKNEKFDLVAKSDIADVIGNTIFVHDESDIIEELGINAKEIIYTSKLIEENPKKFFTALDVESPRIKPFYFRPSDVEFKTTDKQGRN